MMHTVLLVTFAPLIQLLLLFLPAYLLSRLVGRRMRSGRLKRFLFKRL
jgi:hypothetical protein